jgi:hypothetical protein
MGGTGMAKTRIEAEGEPEDLLLAQEQQSDEEVLDGLLEDTHRVLKQSVDRAGPKRVARALDISLSLVYKWTQPPRTKHNPAASGARNPLDKLVTIFHLSQDLEMIHFLCRVAKGYYTSNPDALLHGNRNFVTATVRALNDFANMIHHAEQSLTDDGIIDDEESLELRAMWDKLKGQLERFIVSCEEGHFNTAQTPNKQD